MVPVVFFRIDKMKRFTQGPARNYGWSWMVIDFIFCQTPRNLVARFFGVGRPFSYRVLIVAQTCSDHAAGITRARGTCPAGR